MGRSCCETQHLVGRMLDHIVLVTSNFRQDAEWLADRTGISGTYGGHNPVNGTHNMLFPLSAGAYLELLAADEQRPATAERALPFGLDQLTGRSVAAWAACVALMASWPFEETTDGLKVLLVTGQEARRRRRLVKRPKGRTSDERGKSTRVHQGSDTAVGPARQRGAN